MKTRTARRWLQVFPLALLLAASGKDAPCGEQPHEGQRPYHGFTNQFYRADFYPQSIVQKDYGREPGLRHAWTRITYMANVTDKQGDLTVQANVGDVMHVFSEYDCQKRLVRVVDLSTNERPSQQLKASIQKAIGFATVGGRVRASEFYTPAPGSVEEAALDYFCRPVAPHSAASNLDKFWLGMTKPWKAE